MKKIISCNICKGLGKILANPFSFGGGDKICPACKGVGEFELGDISNYVECKICKGSGICNEKGISTIDIFSGNIEVCLACNGIGMVTRKIIGSKNEKAEYKKELHLKKDNNILKNQTFIYVNLDRINELKQITNCLYDLTKLVKYCEEINKAFENKCYFSVAMLVRAIIDHVPPIFNCTNFSEIVNNYKGSRSFKESMKHLELSSRKIADSFLHTQIRKSETLPTQTQIDFSNDLDVLLAEIRRITKKL